MFESVSKPHGAICLDGHQSADTLQCCHCGHHFAVVKGSGRIRGFCRKCMGPTCGEHKCDACVPWQKKIEEYEQGKRAVLD